MKANNYTFIDPETGTIMVKHYNFVYNIMEAVSGRSNKNIFFFGGGIRGGKTYTCLYSLILIAHSFPGTRIHIIRDCMPSLISTVLPSLLKLLQGGYRKHNKDKSNYYFEFDNGSRIYFFPESIDKDKDLDRFKGLETNIIFLEQIENLSEKTFQKAQERMGTYRFADRNSIEPRPLILSTFNPTHVKWIREQVYLPYKSNKIPDNVYIEMVRAVENPFVADYQWQAWGGMDSTHYKQYVEGDWEVFDNIKAFCYAFDANKHVREIKPTSLEICISFDFNVDPLVCLIAEVGDDYLYIYREIRQSNSDVYALCQELYPLTRTHYISITGDASGNNRTVAARDHASVYDIIRRELNIGRAGFKVPRKNLGLKTSRIICNTALERMDIRIDPSCEFLIEDLLTVEVTDKGEIDKKKDSSKSHLLDCFRYYIQTYFYKTFMNENIIHLDG